MQIRMFKVCSLVLLAALLAGCAGATPTIQATVDTGPTLQAVQTQAAQTVVADLTLNAPSATPVIPTATQPAATETSVPTATATTALVVIPTATTTVFVPTVPAFTSTPANTATPTSIACQITEQSPAFGDDHPKNADFDGRWVIKNTGTQTWAASATDIRFITGTKFHTGADAFDLSADVAPNGTYTFIVDMVSPNTSGRHSATWAVVQGGTTLCTMNVTIDVLD